MFHRRVFLGSAAAVAAAAGLSACNSDGQTGAATDAVLVVNDSFDIRSIDPARQFEFTGSMLDHQIYERTLMFKGNDVKNVVPGLCTYKVSDDAKVLTLTLDGEHHFSDGSPVTADDIVFSYQRVVGIA